MKEKAGNDITDDQDRDPEIEFRDDLHLDSGVKDLDVFHENLHLLGQHAILHICREREKRRSARQAKAQILFRVRPNVNAHRRSRRIVHSFMHKSLDSGLQSTRLWQTRQRMIGYGSAVITPS